MQVFVNYPKIKEDKKILLDNLATFKAELLLKSIENLNVCDKTKDEVLEKVFEILDDSAEDSVI